VIRVVHPGSGCWLFYPSRIPDPGVKKAPDPWSGSATLLFGVPPLVFDLWRSLVSDQWLDLSVDILWPHIFCAVDVILTNVVDPHHLDADPDSTHHPDADMRIQMRILILDVYLMRIRIFIRCGSGCGYGSGSGFLFYLGIRIWIFFFIRIRAGPGNQSDADLE
jgi:hypothetical protein